MSATTSTKSVLIHMSDDHFIIENQDNKEILEFKGKYARVEANAMMNRLTRKDKKCQLKNGQKKN